MDHFSFFIEDERYTVPNLVLVLVSDVARAREMAVQKLWETPEHLSIQVFQGEKLIFTVSRDPSEEDEEIADDEPPPTAVEQIGYKARLLSP